MSYADVSDVAVELGRPASSDAESEQWQAWLDRVERSIERAFRRAGLVLEAQVGLGDPTVADVVDVEVAAVIRKIHLPVTGRTSTSRAVDDVTITDRWEGDTAGLEISAAEWDALLPGGDVDAFSTRPGFEPDTRWPSPWYPLV